MTRDSQTPMPGEDTVERRRAGDRARSKRYRARKRAATQAALPGTRAAAYRNAAGQAESLLRSLQGLPMDEVTLPAVRALEAAVLELWRAAATLAMGKGGGQ